jgi:hypothetical protein
VTDQVVRIEGSAELRTRYVREVYEHGVRDGLRLASAAIADRVAAALERPDGHGGVGLDVETQHTVMDLYARYLGVMSFADGVPPQWLSERAGNPSLQHGAGCTGSPCVCIRGADLEIDPSRCARCTRGCLPGPCPVVAGDMVRMGPGDWDLRSSAETP